MIVAILNAKGGVGKTTLAVHLARARHDRKPVLFDLDEQAASADFQDGLKGCQVRQCTPARAAEMLAGIGARLAILDCPPSPVAARPVLACAHVVVVPVRAAYLPLRATVNFVDILQRAVPQLPCRIVLNEFVPGLESAREARNGLREAFGEMVCKTIIHRSNAIERASARGLTVFDTQPESRAAKQMHALADELLP